MEAPERHSPAALELLRQLAKDGPPSTGFFPAIRLLERLVDMDVRVGGDGPYSREPIRFSHEASMTSQPNEISAIRGHKRYEKGEEVSATQWVYEVCTCFLGLTGTDSPLPLYLVSEFAQLDDAALLQREFLDVFHNRLLALFYRGVSRYDFPQELLSDATDPVATRALQLAGFDVEVGALAGVSRAQLLHVAALFATGPVTPRTLRNSLRALLRRELGGVELGMRELTGGWVVLDDEQCNRLGRANNEAGLNFLIGTRVRHPAHEARVVIGPLPPADAAAFSPGGPSFERVAHLLDALCPAPAVVKLELHIRTGAFPPFVLGQRRIARDACIMGRRHRDESVVIAVHDLPRIGERQGARAV